MTGIIHVSTNKKLELPLFLSRVKAGFPSPADDYVDCNLDLNEHLISHEQATFFIKASGDSMKRASINTGDLLVVDKSLEPHNGSVVVACIDGEFTVKYFHKNDYGIYLIPGNPKYKEIVIKEGMDFEVWGVVTYVIHQV